MLGRDVEDTSLIKHKSGDRFETRDERALVVPKF